MGIWAFEMYVTILIKIFMMQLHFDTADVNYLSPSQFIIYNTIKVNNLFGSYDVLIIMMYNVVKAVMIPFSLDPLSLF